MFAVCVILSIRPRSLHRLQEADRLRTFNEAQQSAVWFRAMLAVKPVILEVITRRAFKGGTSQILHRFASLLSDAEEQCLYQAATAKSRRSNRLGSKYCMKKQLGVNAERSSIQSPPRGQPRYLFYCQHPDLYLSAFRIGLGTMISGARTISDGMLHAATER
jgi:hypothetical protein